MQNLTSLEWATPQLVELILWIWVAVGITLILERTLLFATPQRLSPIGREALSENEWRFAAAWFVKHDARAYRRLLDKYGEIAMALGMAGTIVSLMASDQFRGQNKAELFSMLAIALRTTLVGVLAAVLVTVVFGDLVWPGMQKALLLRWKLPMPVKKRFASTAVASAEPAAEAEGCAADQRRLAQAFAESSRVRQGTVHQDRQNVARTKGDLAVLETRLTAPAGDVDADPLGPLAPPGNSLDRVARPGAAEPSVTCKPKIGLEEERRTPESEPTTRDSAKADQAGEQTP